MNRYLTQSTLVHVAFFAVFFLISHFSPHQKVIWLDGTGFDYRSGGGSGKGKSSKGGIKASQKGQPVPKPSKVPVPDKPAPVQKATQEEKPWKVKDKNSIKTVPTKVGKKATADVPIGEKTQKTQSNIIRRGTKKGAGTEVGENGFSFDSGSGVGIGVGPGTGGGFGFGGYLSILRKRIWSEWTQYTTIGNDKSCVVGLTVSRNGQVSEIRLETSSGDSFFDDVARRSIRNASPLPPLPPTFPKSNQRFRIKFQLID